MSPNDECFFEHLGLQSAGNKTVNFQRGAAPRALRICPGALPPGPLRRTGAQAGTLFSGAFILILLGLVFGGLQALGGIPFFQARKFIWNTLKIMSGEI